MYLQIKRKIEIFQLNKTSDLVNKSLQCGLLSFTFGSSRRFGYPHGTISTFFFSIIRSQENLSLICFRVTLQMIDAICGWSHRGVEVSGVNDVGFWKPVGGIGQF